MPVLAKAYAGRRDPRFVTIRRGGSLADPSHRLLALWAAGCAAHVLGLFTAARPGDDRPAVAIATARRWAAGEVSMVAARNAALAAHAAARAVSGSAQLAALAAGHAAATAHMADHELGAACFALRAVQATAPDNPGTVARERRWQRGQLPPAVAELVLDDMRGRSVKFGSVFDPD
ncbi:hypothetical protein BH11MYX1_BH11MYX1_27830 [soil metagenome]